MEKPKLSSNFTMDDLHLLREYNSLRRINMSVEELAEDINKGANEMERLIEQIRKSAEAGVSMTA